MHNAIYPLQEKDRHKLQRLIEALKLIRENCSSRKTTIILNDVEKYLNQWLSTLNTDASESSQKETPDWFQTVYKLLSDGINIHAEVNSLSQNQKKELLALGYYLQGKLSTDEEFSYIKKVLRSYLKTIAQFRGLSSPE